jgi:ubiquinone/menaquinone biosynthesis C-methylase UbiE
MTPEVRANILTNDPTLRRSGLAIMSRSLAIRARIQQICDEKEALRVDGWTTAMEALDHEAVWQDLAPFWQPRPTDAILDAGAGTGALCLTLMRRPHRSLTALDPSAPMLERLKAKPMLRLVHAVQGFCDDPHDSNLFASSSFDAITSRQLTNGLIDPLAAFANWHRWLREGGTVVVIDGLYDRDAWSGPWQELVDQLPLAACRTMATVPYLLERSGFQMQHVGWMHATNQRPLTQTPRYAVIARKISLPPECQSIRHPAQEDLSTRSVAVEATS